MKILRMLLLMTILLIPLEAYGESLTIERAWLGVFKYNGTYYDPLGNTFEGDDSYQGPHYYYVVINYELSNGEIIRQVIDINDVDGTTNPAPTALVSWTAPNGTTYTIFKADGTNTYNETPLPYIVEIEPGSIVEIIMNDNHNDNNYADGYWKINVSKNGIEIIRAWQEGAYFHNLSFVLQNLNRSVTWRVFMPYKNYSENISYTGSIPFNGPAIISTDDGQTLQQNPPPGFINQRSSLSIRVPVPIGAVIVSTVVILLITYRRVEEIGS